MPDEQKTETELLRELGVLRRRVSELEQQVADLRLAEQETANLAKLPTEDPNPVLRISKDCTILYANDASSIVLQTWQRQVGQPLPEPCCQQAKEAVSRGKVSTFEFSCVDGRIFLVTLAPVAQEGYLNAYGVDITERKQKEDELRQYQFMIESAYDAIFFKDRSSRYIVANKKTLEAFGLSAEQVIGKNDYEIMPDKKQAKKNIEDDNLVFRTRKPTEITKRMTGADGKERWFQAIKVPQSDDKGSIIGLIGIARDITEQRITEDVSRESERKFRLFVENLNGIAVRGDLEGKPEFLLGKLEEITGYTWEDFSKKGLKWFDVMQPDDRERFIEQGLRQVRLGKPVIQEYRIVRKDGGIRWVSQSISPEIKEDAAKPLSGAPFGGVKFVEGVITDITDRKKAEAALKESEAKYRDLVEEMTDVIYTVDAEGIVTSVSKAEKAVFGRDPAEVVGRHFTGAVQPECRADVMAAFERVLGGESITMETAALDKDGKLLYIELSSIPIIKDGVVVGARGIIRDTTTRNKAEEQLRETRQRLEYILATTPATTYTCKAGGTWPATFISENIKKQFGYEPRQFVEDPNFWSAHIHPDDRERVIAELSALFENDFYIHEYRFLHKDGHYRWVHDEVRLIRDQKAEPLECIGYWTDVTDRKNAEYELRESHKKYRELVDNITDGVYQTDTQGNFTYVNKIIEERAGIPAEKFVGLNFRDVVIPEYHQIVNANLARFLAGEQVPPFEVEYRTAAGQTITVETNVRPIYAGDTITGIQGISRDITQRNKVEKKLKESEATLRSIIDSVTESVLLIEPDGTVRATNRVNAERLGTTIDGLIGKCAYDFIPPDLAASRKLHIEKVVRTGEPVIFDDIRATRHILNSLHPIKDSTGKVTKLAIFAFDITEHKKLEQALRESELRYRTLFESSPVGLGLGTTDGKILDSNSAMVRMTGYSDTEIRQVNLKDTYVNPQERARLLKELQTNGSVRDFQVQLKRKDGTTYWANMNVIPFPFAGENAILAAQVDITECKQAEEALRQNETKYRTLVENLPQRVFLKDKDSVYISCNENYARDLRIKADQIVGKTDYDFYPKELAEKYRVDDRRIVESGQITDIEEKYILEGQEFIVHTVKTPVADEQGNVIAILGIFWDITESRRRERELNLYREKMGQAERLASLGTLSATVAHELTQPMTTIRLSIENSLAQLEATSCPADILEELKDGLEGVSDAVSVVDRIRNFARQSSEKAITEVNLREVAERIVRLLDRNAQQANISVQLKDLEKLPPIYAREKDMEQLFFALADNAIHAADGKRKRQLTISGAVEDERIELRFADNCGGIAPENVDKIFEPFFTTRPAGEGTGLGLCIVQHIVFRAGGKVWVQNKPGKGATFFVTLPIGKTYQSLGR